MVLDLHSFLQQLKRLYRIKTGCCSTAIFDPYISVDAGPNMASDKRKIVYAGLNKAVAQQPYSSPKSPVMQVQIWLQINGKSFMQD